MKTRMSPKRGRKSSATRARCSRSRRVGQAHSRYALLPGSTGVTPRGGNVFADLGFAPEEAENLTLRSDLIIALRRAIDGMTQVEAAALLGVAQPRISDLRCDARMTT